MTSLLQKAKEVAINKRSKFNKEITREEIELALAVCKDEVTGSQAAVALDIKPTSIDGRIKQVIYMAIKQGLIEATLK